MRPPAVGPRQVVQTRVIERTVQTQNRDVGLLPLLIQPLRRGLVAAAVVDQHQFVGDRAGTTTDRRDADPGERHLVPEGNQD